MDLISAFKSELFRPLATVVAPGAIASTPLTLTFIAENQAVIPYAEKYVGASAFVFILLCVIAGFILENVGARIEHIWDRRIEKRNKSHHSQWDAYLRLKTKDEIVGQRYLRTIVTRMKFELSIAPALIACTIGLHILNHYRNYWTNCGLLLASILLILLAAYMLYESYCSAKICAHARDQVISSASAP